MAVEYIRYRMASHSPEQLIAAYALAAAQLDLAPECLAYELTRCVEDPACLILRIEWTSTEAHLEGFRRGPHFPPFLAAIRPFIGEIEEMRHYELTDPVVCKG